MILFINVFLDHNPSDLLNSPQGIPYNRFNLPHRTKGEVFLYTLHSYKTIEWSKVIIYCEMNELFPDKEKYYQEIKNIFPNCELYKTRNAYQWQWQSAIDKLDDIDDDLIWFAGNHDHTYIARDHKQLESLIDSLKNCEEEYFGAVYSHHPEICARYMRYPVFEWKHESKLVSSCYANFASAIMILNKNLFKYWWFKNDYGDNFLPRPDWANGANCQSLRHKIFFPVQELCRHFDGHEFGSYSFDINDIPPLDIPEGFWDKNIKIDFLTEKRNGNNIWVNPLIPNYFVKDLDGVDYKCLIEDLPLFWKDRISEINQPMAVNNFIRKQRNLAILNSVNARAYFANETVLDYGAKNFRMRLNLSYIKGILSS